MFFNIEISLGKTPKKPLSFCIFLISSDIIILKIGLLKIMHKKSVNANPYMVMLYKVEID